MSDLSGKWQLEAATTASAVNSAAAARAELCNLPDWPVSSSQIEHRRVAAPAGSLQAARRWRGMGVC